MCGIAGYITSGGGGMNSQCASSLIKSIRHRGPDDEGLVWINRAARRIDCRRTELTAPGRARSLPDYRETSSGEHDVALIHTRYAIIDLSEGGHQPFLSADNTVACVFNGEIYNYIEVRQELEAVGIRFRTNCDTEVLVEGYRYWGDAVWSHLNGFWAAALYDSSNSTIVLSRDRLGIAPLYYRETNEGFFFASNLSALVTLGEKAPIDDDMVAGFISTSLKDFRNLTCFSGVKSIPAGTVVQFAGEQSVFSNARVTKFWDLPTQRLTESDLSLNDAIRVFRDSFVDAVQLRLRADVKVAFELSGGLDSSSIVAVAANLRDSDITTFTIEVPEQNEEPFARAILDRYPVDYQVLRAPETNLFEEFESFVEGMEEPFHSPNIYTHYRMRARMKAAGVDAVLSGSGGDEVLAGYEQHFWPRGCLELHEAGLGRHAAFYQFRRRWGGKGWADCALRFPAFVGDVAALVRPSCPAREQAKLFATKDHGSTRAGALQTQYDTLSFHEQQLFHFRVGLLPYYLRSNDHFTMLIPLEHRFPFLDYRIVELGTTMPISYLYRRGWTKYLLRRAMEPFLPPKILWRRTKMGFPFAIREFLVRHRNRVEPLLESTRQAGFRVDETINDRLSRASASRVWRAASTGAWIDRMVNSSHSGQVMTSL